MSCLDFSNHILKNQTMNEATARPKRIHIKWKRKVPKDEENTYFGNVYEKSLKCTFDVQCTVYIFCWFFAFVAFEKGRTSSRTLINRQFNCIYVSSKWIEECFIARDCQTIHEYNLRNIKKNHFEIRRYRAILRGIDGFQIDFFLLI